MKNYQITIGYRAVITVDLKAKTSEEAKKLAIEKFSDAKGKLNGKCVSIQDDNYKADGVLDMDATWKMYDK